jgi:hypothetical protein
LTVYELTHTIQQTGGLQLNKSPQIKTKPQEEEENLQAKQITGQTPENYLSNKEIPTQQPESEQPQQIQTQEIPTQQSESEPGQTHLKLSFKG